MEKEDECTKKMYFRGILAGQDKGFTPGVFKEFVIFLRFLSSTNFQIFTPCVSEVPKRCLLKYPFTSADVTLNCSMVYLYIFPGGLLN